MKLGYARISKADGSQTLDLQVDALAAAGVAPEHVYQDEASGKRDDRPGLEACLKALREGDTLYICRSRLSFPSRLSGLLRRRRERTSPGSK